MRTVRSAARWRNRARPGLFVVIVAALIVLITLVARANAQPAMDVDPTELEEEITVIAGAAGPEVELDADAYARVARDAPPAGDVVAAAYRAAGLDRDPVPGLARRARFASLIPSITVRGGEDATWRDVTDPTIGHVTVFDVSATWHLDRMVFDGSELRTTSMEQARRRERRRLALRVVRIYYRWLASSAVAERTGRPSARADEAAAELDALTDGWFARGQENLPGSRTAPHH